MKSWFQCKLCKHLCASKYRLHLHLRNHPFTPVRKNPVKEGSKDQNEDQSKRAKKLNKRKMLRSRSSISTMQKYDPSQFPFHCSACGKGFEKQYNLDRHTVSVHKYDGSGKEFLRNRKDPMQCRICGLWCSSLFSVERHMRRRHRDDGSEHKCPTCGKIFLNQLNMERHYMLAHTDYRARQKSGSSQNLDDERVQCKLCDAMFRYRRNAYEHLRKIHVVDPEEKHLLSVTKSEYEEWMERERPKSGQGSSMKSLNRADGKENMNCSGAQRMLEKIECHVCGKIFRYRRNLKSHLQTLHKIKVVSDDENVSGDGSENEGVMEPIECHKCGKVFRYRRNLKSHLQKLHKIKVTSDDVLSSSSSNGLKSERNERSGMDREGALRHQRSGSINGSPEKFGKGVSKRQFVQTNAHVKCRKCGKLFVHKTSLYRHFRNNHGFDNIEENDIVPVNVKIRKEVRTKVKMPMMKKIGVRSEQASAIQKEGGSSTNGVEAKCLKCGRLFRYRRYCFDHVKRAHKIYHNVHKYFRTYRYQAERTPVLKAWKEDSPVKKSIIKDGKEESRWKCLKCGKKFVHRRYCWMHLKRVHKITHNTSEYLQELDKLDRITQISKAGADRARGSKCRFCGKVYSSISNLKRHVKIAHQNRNKGIVDKSVEISTNQEDNNEEENETVHQYSKTKCRFCGKVYSCFSNLNRHIKIAHKKNRNKGIVYKSVKISTNQAGNRKASVKNRNDEPGAKCLRCGQVFMYRRNCLSHVKNVHGILTTVQRYIRELPSLDRKALESSMTDVKCKECGKSFEVRQQLYKHLKEDHGKGQQNTIDWECSLCGKNFPNQYRLTCHVIRCKTEREIADLNYKSENKSEAKCRFCGKVYSTIWNLKRHVDETHKNTMKGSEKESVEISTNEQDSEEEIETDHENLNQREADTSENINVGAVESSETKCRFCGKIYSAVSSLNRHVKIAHKKRKKGTVNKSVEIFLNEEENIEEDWKCNSCGKIFSSPYRLKCHVTRCAIEIEIADRNFRSRWSKAEAKCRFCGKVYSTIWNLKRHVDEAHTDIMKGNVNECGEISTNEEDNIEEEIEAPHENENLDETEVADTNEDINEAKCKFCGKVYSSIWNLRRHVKTGHRKRRKRIVNKSLANSRSEEGNLEAETETVSENENLDEREERGANEDINAEIEVGPDEEDMEMQVNADEEITEMHVCSDDENTGMQIGTNEDIMGLQMTVDEEDMEMQINEDEERDIGRQCIGNEDRNIGGTNECRDIGTEVGENSVENVDASNQVGESGDYVIEANVMQLLRKARQQMSDENEVGQQKLNRNEVRQQKLNRNEVRQQKLNRNEVRQQKLHRNENRTGETSSNNTPPMQWDWNKGRYICTVCRQEYTRADSVWRHIHARHPHIVKQLTESESAAVEDSHEEGVIEFECDLCGEEFSERDSIKAHMRRIHPEECRQSYFEPIFSCEVCGEEFSQADSVTKHMKTRHSSESCTLDNLPKSGEFLCDFCGEKFSTADSVKEHMKRQHPEVSNIADDSDKSDSNPSRGCVTADENETIQSDDGRFLCSVCGTTYTRKDILQQHMGSLHPDIFSVYSELPSQEQGSNIDCRSMERNGNENRNENNESLNELVELDECQNSEREQNRGIEMSREHDESFDDVLVVGDEAASSDNLFRKVWGKW